MRLAAVALALVMLSGGQSVTQPSDRTGELLQELIRIDTSNPPGREGQIGDLMARKLRPLGFEIEMIPTPEPGKSHFIARLRGDGSRRPVLLAAHADVVGVERDKWSVDPFGGILREGRVYGRGAIDFKGGVAVFARAVMMLAERRVPLARDVIFMVEADEESQPYNTTWLAARHWPKMDCEFALNEGGWIIKADDGRVKYVSISTADKVSVAVTVTARGTSAHSSMPRPDSAIFALSKAMARLADYDPKVELLPITRRFLSMLATVNSPPVSDHLRTLATSSDPAAIAAADKVVSRDPMIHAMIRNTIAPVMLNAGFRGNVIPGSAQATINLRVLPGTDPADVVGELQRAVGDSAVDVQLSRPSTGPVGNPPSSENTDLYRALRRHTQGVFSGAEVSPYLFHAGTDAGPWRSRGIPVYGIYPYPITADELSRMHGNDEQVSVESLRLGTEWVYRTLVEVAGRQKQ
jgi:acetylornithine deacetylase/succinyl-diaminopimelate desuccinylase-like protein